MFQSDYSRMFIQEPNRSVEWSMLLSNGEHETFEEQPHQLQPSHHFDQKFIPSFPYDDVPSIHDNRILEPSLWIAPQAIWNDMSSAVKKRRYTSFEQYVPSNSGHDSKKRRMSEGEDGNDYLTDSQVHACPHCDKSFNRLYNLKSHLKTHTADKPFVCEVCNQAFSRNHDLRRHSKIHSGVKAHHCTACNKSFTRQDALTRHQGSRRCLGHRF